MSRLKDKYKKEVITVLKEQFGYKNDLEVPRLEKVVINCGTGKFAKESKSLDKISHILSVITGQKPIVTKAKKAISGFKIRQGMPVGFLVTLRGERMYDFLDKLISIVLPRVRDFRGLNLSAFDGHGNYTIGISEHTVFPEISYEDTEQIFGLEVSIATTTSDNKEGRKLLELLGFPFKHG